MSDVTRVQLIQMRGARMRMLRFGLQSGAERRNVQILCPSRRGVPDTNLQIFLSLVSESAARLAELSPELTYRMEESGPKRSALFALGLVGLTVGLILTGLAFLTLYDDLWRLLLSLPGLAALKFGSALLIHRFWPFRQPEAFPIGTLPFILWTMGGPKPRGLALPQPAPMS
ncbi:hypothetical protein KM176_17130 [Pseudooceanicola sp. CBS1P-1]|uniref:Uncharacterized protein n=1 Tax=Pseudooceanicola albus TaxID=2692189 RepID=A0A6L7G5Q1_9RHOB|nr:MULTISPECIES: hypothetical protein [Pseudooceanicola]MBT9385598.1 hypothetical protein [Pseudooceanicola endophyticus]MXN18992.1 hypothetical protein [Pseudooceanicola albus]